MAAPKGNQYAKGHGQGRPSAYKPEYCQDIIDHFSKEPVTTLYKREYFQSGQLKSEIPILTPASFPTMQKFADSIGVTTQTIRNWAEEHKDFFEALTRAKELQEHIWLVNGMGNLYNSQFAQFFGKNCLGYKDRTETEITGRDGGPIQYEDMSAEDRQRRIAELLGL